MCSFIFEQHLCANCTEKILVITVLFIEKTRNEKEQKT